MGWEIRNGTAYYYKKERVNGRVKSTYLGKGAIALLEEQLAELGKRRTQQERLEARITQAQFAKLARPTAELVEASQAAAHATAEALHAAGYHQHKHQWRKKRGSKNQNQEADNPAQ